MKLKINLPAAGCAIQSTFDPDPDEIEVAGYLLDLPHLIELSEKSKAGSSSLPFSWGRKSKRSVFYNAKSNPSPPSLLLPPPPSSPLKFKIPVLPSIRTAPFSDVSSPASPLMVSFSPKSECEERVPPTERRKKKEAKKRERLLQELEERRENIEILKKNILAVMEYYEKLKAYNICLKARKEELSRKDESKLELEGTGSSSSSSRRVMCTNTGLQQSVGISISHATGCSVFVTDQTHHLQQPMINSRVHQQPLIMDPTGGVKAEVGIDGFVYSNGQMVSWVAAGVPHLGGSWQLFHDRASSKAARHKRRLICKDKNISTNKFK